MNDLAKQTIKLLGENYICETVKVRKNASEMSILST